MTTNLIPATVQATVNRTMRMLANPQALGVALGAWRYRMENMIPAQLAKRAPIVEAIKAIEANVSTEGVCVECDGNGEDEYEEDRFCYRDGHYTVTQRVMCRHCKGNGFRLISPWERVCHRGYALNEPAAYAAVTAAMHAGWSLSAFETNSSR